QDAQNIGLQLFLARHYAQFARPADAERVYMALLAQSPSPEIYQSLFRLYQTQGKTAGAIKILELLDTTITKAAKKDNSASEAARCAAQVRDIAAAIRSDRQLSSAVVPTARERLSTGGALQCETLYFLASLASRARWLEDAEIFYRSCLGSADSTRKTFPIY